MGTEEPGDPASTLCPRPAGPRTRSEPSCPLLTLSFFTRAHVLPLQQDGRWWLIHSTRPLTAATTESGEAGAAWTSQQERFRRKGPRELVSSGNASFRFLLWS